MLQLAVAMSDSAPVDRTDDVLDLLPTAEHAFDRPPVAARFRAAEVRATLDRIEAATPGEAPLHAHLDAVRKWLGALDRPDDHDRFGGAQHLHAHVAAQ